MKFFVGVFMGVAFLVGATHMGISTRVHTHNLVPSKIVDKKKIDPIEIPYIDCIVSVEVPSHTLEEHTVVCLAKRTWLRISVDKEEHTIF
jgi:hypothetical protein